jgi:hypothetical protein
MKVNVVKTVVTTMNLRWEKRDILGSRLEDMVSVHGVKKTILLRQLQETIGQGVSGSQCSQAGNEEEAWVTTTLTRRREKKFRTYPGGGLGPNHRYLWTPLRKVNDFLPFPRGHL